MALTGVRLGPALTAVEQVRRMGHRPEDVRDIVVTHRDLDHAGGEERFGFDAVHANFYIGDEEPTRSSR